ncbi:MAG: hypothetical protein P4L27_04955 [Ignavibacteriaceae bacterium]|nr:hypothetical protein [Ignavibacteriaceae bacterium]
MKNIYILSFLLTLLLMGCSSTLTIENFSSKDKFYENFNKFAKDKDLNVVLTNDSAFTLTHGAVLENDTLFSFGKPDHKTLSMSDLKKINYTTNDYKSADVLTEKDEKFKAENIIAHNDSISFVVIDPQQAGHNIIPVSQIKTVSYKNRWLRLPLGILAGGFTGLLTGGLIVANVNAGKDDSGIVSGGEIIPAVLGAVIGGIIGIISGYDYYYQFNI